MKIEPYKKCPKCGCVSYGRYHISTYMGQTYCANCKAIYGEEEPIYEELIYS